MAGKRREPKQRKDALSVQRLINEVLVQTLGIPSHNIVNDAAFSRYTDSQRPDILISNVAYLNNPGDIRNEEDFINNLICYAEAKDISCKVDDADWKDAIRQGMEKAPKLGLSYFAVTNCSITYFYNLDGRRLSLNGSPITEFQTMDVMRIMKRVTGENHAATDIDMSVDSLTAVSEAVFNAKLWQLKNIYRGIDFENNMKKIDFTIGLISMGYYEEKAIMDGTYDENLVWWSKARSERSGAQVVTDLLGYIGRLVDDASDFKEFSEPVKVVEASIRGVNPLVRPEQLKEVYEVVDSMRPLHGTGFDLFGAVYEAFANSKEKKDFGEYFTRRHYTHIFAKLLLKGRDIYDESREFNVIDPFCGTGGMLTEAYKVLRSNYKDSNTYDGNARDFLSHRCFYGVDLRSENASRSKLNMFLVGDGHNHIYSDDSLVPRKSEGKRVITDDSYDYVITNPPYGQGTIPADTVFVTSKRMEVSAICRVIDLLKIGGMACIVTPDGVLENPTFKSFREELMLTCEIQAIISLPRFAFAPYTKEKTYALFLRKRYDRFHVSTSENRADRNKKNEDLRKRCHQNGKFQTTPIWMYIVDNDGYANSDKRYPTGLRDANQNWLHNEVSAWVDEKGTEHVSQLEERWDTRYDDSATQGTTWFGDKGSYVTERKGGNISIQTIKDDPYYTLLPEHCLRPYDPLFVTPDEYESEFADIRGSLAEIVASNERRAVTPRGRSEDTSYQEHNVPVKDVLDCMSGNSGLTEELIYSMSLLGGDKYEVLTASTTGDTAMGYIVPCPITKDGKTKQMKVFEDKDGLLVIRKGKAGSTRYLPKGKYTINDDAYILSVKSDCPYKIDLRWLALSYRSEFLAYASNSDNGTWNMTGFFDNVTLDIPTDSEQKRLVQLVNEAQRCEDLLLAVQKKLGSLLKKEIDLPSMGD